MRLSGVELTIDTLVLDGFSPTDGELVRQAAEAELARLVALGGAPRNLRGGGEIAALESTGPAVLPGSPQLVGRQIAERLHARLSS